MFFWITLFGCALAQFSESRDQLKPEHANAPIDVWLVCLLPGKSSVQVVCSGFDTDDFQKNRTQFTVQVKAKLQERCSQFSCDINDVQVNDIRRPSAYEAAIRSKQAAVENVNVSSITQSTNHTAIMSFPLRAFCPLVYGSAAGLDTCFSPNMA